MSRRIHNLLPEEFTPIPFDVVEWPTSFSLVAVIQVQQRYIPGGNGDDELTIPDVILGCIEGRGRFPLTEPPGSTTGT